MKTLVCVDRDGTLIYDDKYHLGRTHDWKSKIKILPTVIKGLELLNSIPGASVYMITNQPGVAIKDFKLLTIERAHEVCKYIIEKLKKQGGLMKGYFLCSHASFKYAEKKKEYDWNEELICDCECIKPRLGMVFDALKAEGITRDNVNIYVIGDRASDVQTALNVNGIGILIPFENEPGEEAKVQGFKDKSSIYIAKNFLDAAQFIVKKEV